MRHSVPIGVQEGGVLDADGKPSMRAMRDLNNKRDWFSPAIGFEGSGRLGSFFLSPFVDVGSAGNPEGFDTAVAPLTYLVCAVLSFVATFVLTFIYLGARYIMGTDGINPAETAIYLGFVYSITWLFLTRYWPFDRRLSPTLNPSIEVTRWLTGDNVGLLGVVLNVGIQLAGAALAGQSIEWLGWQQFGGGPTLINEALNTGLSNNHYGIDFFLTLLVCLSYIAPKKFTLVGQSGEENWTAVTGSTTGAIFVATLFGSPLGFYWFNPAVYLGALTATGAADVTTGDGFLDSIWFIMIRMLVVPLAVAALYYVARGVIWLSERFPMNQINVRWTGYAEKHRSSDRNTWAGPMMNESAQIQTRSSALRNRTAVQEQLRTPLITEY